MTRVGSIDDSNFPIPEAPAQRERESGGKGGSLLRLQQRARVRREMQSYSPLWPIVILYLSRRHETRWIVVVVAAKFARPLNFHPTTGGS